MKIKNFFSRPHYGFWLILLTMGFFFNPLTAFCYESETISLKKYPELAIPVTNPMDLTQMASGKSYQVTHADFILQFFFDGKNIYGIIFKRKKEVSIYIHWCFFRSCEESTYDYKLKIADAFTPPYDQTFFNGKLPSQIKYRFQGMEFFTRQ